MWTRSNRETSVCDGHHLFNVTFLSLGSCANAGNASLFIWVRVAGKIADYSVRCLCE